jgi:hypothetical protein
MAKRVIFNSRGFHSIPSGTPVELTMSKRTLSFIDEIFAPCASMTRSDVLTGALVDEPLDLEQPVFRMVAAPEDVPKSVDRPLTVARKDGSSGVALFVTQHLDPVLVDEILQDPITVYVSARAPSPA